MNFTEYIGSEMFDTLDAFLTVLGQEVSRHNLGFEWSVQKKSER